MQVVTEDNPVTQRILRYMADREAVTQPTLVRQTGLTRAAVHGYVSRLREHGIIHRVGTTESRGGRPAEKLAVDRRRNLTLGVSLGEEVWQVGLMDFADDLVWRRRRAMDSDASREELLGAFDELVDAAGAEAKQRGQTIRYALIAPGAQLDAETGTILRSVLYPHLSGLNLSERLHERLSVPATTALGGHATFCGEPEADVPGYRLAQLMWGRGIDLTVASGRALDFFNTFPGALPVGHMRVAVPGRPCACGRTGCMEAELAGPALTARLADRHEDLAGLSVERMEAEAARGEERIVAELEAAAERLAMHFGPLMQVSTPRELRLIGGLGLAAPRLIEAMHRGFERVLHADQARAMEISVHDDPMTLRLSGACRLGRMEFLTPGLVRRLRVPTRSFTEAAGGSPTWADAEAAMPIEV